MVWRWRWLALLVLALLGISACGGGHSGPNPEGLAATSFGLLSRSTGVDFRWDEREMLASGRVDSWDVWRGSWRAAPKPRGTLSFSGQLVNLPSTGESGRAYIRRMIFTGQFLPGGRVLALKQTSHIAGYPLRPSLENRWLCHRQVRRDAQQLIRSLNEPSSPRFFLSDIPVVNPSFTLQGATREAGISAWRVLETGTTVPIGVTGRISLELLIAKESQRLLRVTLSTTVAGATRPAEVTTIIFSHWGHPASVGMPRVCAKDDRGAA